MKTGLTNEQMRLFVEIIQMVALLDEAVQKYMAEYFSLCDDEAQILAVMSKINGLESACAEVQDILNNNHAVNKPKIDKMTSKYRAIKKIRNYIAHDRRLLVVSSSNSKFAYDESESLLENDGQNLRNLPIENLYKKAREIFESFTDFLNLLYFEPNEEKYCAERRVNLYGK